MAFYNGSANSFDDLRTALFAACVAEGWTLTSDVLSKGAAFVQLTINAADTTSTGIGIILQGGTGYSAGVLVNPSPVTPRLGAPSRDTSLVTWPMEYSIHIFGSPDEVFMVVRYSVDRYLWLAFGLSNVSGLGNTGLWLSAVSRRKRGNSGAAIRISPTTGGSGGTDHPSYTYAASTGALFWNTEARLDAGSHQDAICAGLDGTLWAYRTSSGSTSAGSFQAITAASPHIALSPSAWNSEAILLPVQGYVWRASSKCSLVVNVSNARYIRVDNYEPGQIIQLGADKWRIYPFYCKNIAERDGGSPVDHTGTFGWAIRYDGP